MDVKLDKKKSNSCGGMQDRAEKYAPEGVDGMEAKAIRALGEDSKQLADWLEELKRYKDMEEQGRLVVLPCKIGDTVYEIIEETVPNHYFYISEWMVQDVSMKAVMYADDWASYDYENLYFTREEAEAALEDVKRRNEIH